MNPCNSTAYDVFTRLSQSNYTNSNANIERCNKCNSQKTKLGWCMNPFCKGKKL